MKVDRTKCRHEGQVVKFSLRVTKSFFLIFRALLYRIHRTSERLKKKFLHSWVLQDLDFRCSSRK